MLNVITRKNKNKTDLFKVIHYAVIQISQKPLQVFRRSFGSLTSELKQISLSTHTHTYTNKEFIDVVFFPVEIHYVEIA